MTTPEERLEYLHDISQRKKRFEEECEELARETNRFYRARRAHRQSSVSSSGPFDNGGDEKEGLQDEEGRLVVDGEDPSDQDSLFFQTDKLSENEKLNGLILNRSPSPSRNKVEAYISTAALLRKRASQTRDPRSGSRRSAHFEDNRMVASLQHLYNNNNSHNHSSIAARHSIWSPEVDVDTVVRAMSEQQQQQQEAILQRLDLLCVQHAFLLDKLEGGTKEDAQKREHDSKHSVATDTMLKSFSREDTQANDNGSSNGKIKEKSSEKRQIGPAPGTRKEKKPSAVRAAVRSAAATGGTALPIEKTKTRSGSSERQQNNSKQSSPSPQSTTATASTGIRSQGTVKGKGKEATSATGREGSPLMKALQDWGAVRRHRFVSSAFQQRSDERLKGISEQLSQEEEKEEKSPEPVVASQSPPPAGEKERVLPFPHEEANSSERSVPSLFYDGTTGTASNTSDMRRSYRHRRMVVGAEDDAGKNATTGNTYMVDNSRATSGRPLTVSVTTLDGSSMMYPSMTYGSEREIRNNPLEAYLVWSPPTNA